MKHPRRMIEIRARRTPPVSGQRLTRLLLAQLQQAWQNRAVRMIQRQKRIPGVLLCVALSLLLHILLGCLLILLPPQNKEKRIKMRKTAHVKVIRRAEKKPAEKKSEKAPRLTEKKKHTDPGKEKPFAKTSAETPQTAPAQPEYEGLRNTRAASAPDARHLASAEQAPAMTGEKKEELVTFNQERQKGELEHENKHTQSAPAAATPPQEAQAEAEQAAAPPDAGTPDGQDTPKNESSDTAAPQKDATQALTLSDDISGLLKLQQEEPAEEEQHAARKGLPESAGETTTPASSPRRPRIFHDPSLADSGRKAGFRTHERRSRSSGRFVFGRGASLNVISTPRGAYEALVYRRVAHFWYIACDEHRGDIIPGKITISLRINKQGQINSMALIKRSGASISQQSFTFKAIRKASLPPMPPEVQADVIGELMELIFEFNFD